MPNRSYSRLNAFCEILLNEWRTRSSGLASSSTTDAARPWTPFRLYRRRTGFRYGTRENCIRRRLCGARHGNNLTDLRRARRKTILIAAPVRDNRARTPSDRTVTPTLNPPRDVRSRTRSEAPDSVWFRTRRRCFSNASLSIIAISSRPGA